MPQLAYTPSLAATDNILDDISEIGSDNATESSATSNTPTHESFDHLSRFLPLRPTNMSPTKLTDIFTPPSPAPAAFTPYRKITLRSRVREAKARSAFGSPVMVPLRPESPSPTPTTPVRSSENSPDWTPISVPQTPLAKMGLGKYQ
jgi:hypothetical protein